MRVFARAGNSVNWKYAIGELFLIVTGITIAFGIDAWQEGVSLEANEQQVLNGLRADFEDTLDELNAIRDENDQQILAAQQVLELTGPELPIETSEGDLQDRISALFAPTNIFVGTEGTLQGLLNSQGLGILSSQQLQVRLATWPQYKQKILRPQNDRAELWKTRISPYFSDKFAIRTIDSAYFPDLEPSRFSIDVADLYADLAFENLINEVFFYAVVMLDEIQSAEAEIRAILELIDAELD